MAIKSSGFLKFSEIQAEFGGTNPITLSEYYRGGIRVTNGISQNALVPTSGTVNLAKYYNTVKAFVFNRTLSANSVNYNVRNDAIAGGWDGIMPLIANIVVNSGIVISSTSTGTPAFDTGVSFPSGTTISINNSGNISGLGGAGGAGGVNSSNGSVGASGGLGLRIQYQTTLNNTGTIAGGSGGNGGSAAARTGGANTAISANCSGSLSCIPLTCSIGFCNTNTGTTGATGSSGGVNGSAGLAGSGATFGSAVNCASSGCSGAGCDRRITCSSGIPGAGGLAGASISGNSNITYTSVGTRLGPII